MGTTPPPTANASNLARRKPSEVVWAFLASNAMEGGGKIHTDPDDPGGTTKWGFAQKFNPDIDVKLLTFDTAYARFKRDYWDLLKCDLLPLQVAIPFVIFAFNAGADDAIPALQRGVGTKVDGVVGPATLQAARQAFEATGNAVVNNVLSYQAIKYATGNPKFMRGWFVRLFNVRGFVERESWL